MDQDVQSIFVKDRQIIIESQIGEGGFSFVYLVKDVKSGKHLVMKKMTLNGPDMQNIVKNEIDLMSRLSHENIVKLVAHDIVNSSNGRVALVLMEYCSGGHLLGLVQEASKLKRVLDEAKICAIFHDVLSAVMVLHTSDPPIAHRDLKLENILRSDKGIFKLCDFGSCYIGPMILDSKVAIANADENIEKNTTIMYRAPEMCDFFGVREINEKVDIWALGCILYALLYFKHPFQDAGKLGILSGKFVLPTTPPRSPEIIELLKRMLTVEPLKRANIFEVMERNSAILERRKPDLRGFDNISASGKEVEKEKKKSSSSSGDKEKKKSKKGSVSESVSPDVITKKDPELSAAVLARREKRKKKYGKNDDDEEEDEEAEEAPAPTISKRTSTSTSTKPSSSDSSSLFDWSGVASTIPPASSSTTDWGDSSFGTWGGGSSITTKPASGGSDIFDAFATTSSSSFAPSTASVDPWASTTNSAFYSTHSNAYPSNHSTVVPTSAYNSNHSTAPTSSAYPSNHSTYHSAHSMAPPSTSTPPTMIPNLNNLYGSNSAPGYYPPSNPYPPAMNPYLQPQHQQQYNSYGGAPNPYSTGPSSVPTTYYSNPNPGANNINTAGKPPASKDGKVLY